MLDSRTSGILAHITSLPSPFGIGDLGPSAYRFADFLARSGQRIWQVLPLVPLGYGNSPYASPSTFARNPLLISPERLRQDDLLETGDLEARPELSDHRVDYPAVRRFKYGLLKKAYDRFERGASNLPRSAFETFCDNQADWLDDYALFVSLKHENDERQWTRWDEPLRSRRPDALAAARERLGREVEMHKFWQYLFTRQWRELQQYCHDRSIRFFGDLPIYVAHDSADVWAHPDLFHLDEDGRPTVVAGVPPDYFSETGQRWGNPIYRWDYMQERGYRWWTRRFENCLELVDLLRIDHFRGFEAYWEIPASETTAVNGEWITGPGADLFDTVEENLGPLPLVAEDLGLITPGVTDLMNRLDIPGMAVLQFGFYDAPDSTYLPHNFQRDLVAYTGTHDNNTTVGWWNDLVDRDDQDARRIRRYVRNYLELNEEKEAEIHWSFIRAITASVANTVIFPLQDLLGLDADARMNKPGSEGENWAWRFRPDQLTDARAERLRRWTKLFGRAGDA